MKLDRSDITAFLALLVSLAALLVSIIEANIMRDQQEIMQSQQKAAVYPYLSQKVNFKYGDTSMLSHTIENKGLGPAKIKSSSFKLNGESIANYKELKVKLDEIFPDSIKYSISFFDPKSYFITSKEKINVLLLTCQDLDAALAKLGEVRFEVEFCYCSIFEDCWSNDGDEMLEACP